MSQAKVDRYKKEKSEPQKEYEKRKDSERITQMCSFCGSTCTGRMDWIFSIQHV